MSPYGSCKWGPKWEKTGGWATRASRWSKSSSSGCLRIARGRVGWDAGFGQRRPSPALQSGLDGRGPPAPASVTARGRVAGPCSTTDTRGPAALFVAGPRARRKGSDCGGRTISAPPSCGRQGAWSRRCPTRASSRPSVASLLWLTLLAARMHRPLRRRSRPRRRRAAHRRTPGLWAPPASRRTHRSRTSSNASCRATMSRYRPQSDIGRTAVAGVAPRGPQPRVQGALPTTRPRSRRRPLCSCHRHRGGRPAGWLGASRACQRASSHAPRPGNACRAVKRRDRSILPSPTAAHDPVQRARSSGRVLRAKPIPRSVRGARRGGPQVRRCRARTVGTPAGRRPARHRVRAETSRRRCPPGAVRRH